MYSIVELVLIGGGMMLFLCLVILLVYCDQVRFTIETDPLENYIANLTWPRPITQQASTNIAIQEQIPQKIEVIINGSPCIIDRVNVSSENSRAGSIHA